MKTTNQTKYKILLQCKNIVLQIFLSKYSQLSTNILY